jgi:nicotinamide-nucleotide amidase
MPHSEIKYTEPLSADSNERSDDIAKKIVDVLSERHETLAAAESLTGGLLMAHITSVEGSSQVFRGGMVTYATPLKHKLLGVDPELILEHGVVDGEVALQMALGAQLRTTVNEVPTTWGISTTGVAGAGWTEDKPPGTVFIGISSNKDSEFFGPFQFPGGREKVREEVAKEALVRLREKLNVVEVEGPLVVLQVLG